MATEIINQIESALARKRGRYSVQLCNVGNPDIRQDHSKPLPGTGVGWARVDSFEEASDLCRLYIEYYDLGGVNWMGGTVTDSRGLVVARVRYNGRVWKGPGEGERKEFPIRGRKTAAQHEAEGWKDCRV